jgi:hypothetical protein
MPPSRWAALVERAWHGEGKRRDRRVEAIAVGGYHVIAPLHGAHRGLERTKARVFECRPRNQHRLFPNHAWPLVTLDLSVGVGDDPLPRHQLGPLGADIRDADVILEEVLVLGGGAALGYVFALDLEPSGSSASWRPVSLVASLIVGFALL